MKNVVYLLPGTMCTAELWQPLINLLKPSFDFEFLDIPNGKNFEQLAKHYAQLLPDEKINLVGFSLGGYVASYLTCKYPERINKVLVIANSPTELTSREQKQRADILTFVKQYGYKGISPARANYLLDKQHHNGALTDKIIEMDKAFGQQDLISQFEFTTARQDLATAIQQSQVPFHFYHSKGDPLVQHDWFADNFPHPDSYTGTNRVTITQTKSSGHMLPLEKPDELADIFKNWIAV